MLYASSFLDDRVYKLNPTSGEVLAMLSINADLIGGLAVGGGHTYASRIRPGQLFEIDANDGAVLRTLNSLGDLTAGLAYANGALFLGDPETQRLYRINATTGFVETEFAPPFSAIAGLATGGQTTAPPYVLRLDIAEERLEADGSVVYILETGLYDSAGQLVQSNNRSVVAHVLSEAVGEFFNEPNQVLSGGMASLGIKLPTGARVLLEARLSGLAPAQVSLGAIAPTERIVVTLTPDAGDETPVEIAAELFDSFGLLATSATNAVSFRVAYGGGVLAGAGGGFPRRRHSAELVAAVATENASGGRGLDGRSAAKGAAQNGRRRSEQYCAQRRVDGKRAAHCRARRIAAGAAV